MVALAACILGSGLFTVFPLQVSLIAIAAATTVALLYIAGYPNLILLALVAVSITNFTEVAIARWQLPSMTKFLFVYAMLSLILSVAQGKHRIAFKPKILGIVIFYFLASAATVFWAYKPLVAYDGVVLLFFDMLFIVLLLVMVQDLPTLRTLSRVFLFSISFVAALGAIKMGIGDLTLDMFGFAHVSEPGTGDDVDSNRLAGPFTDPNAYARILLLAIPFAILEAAFARSLLMRGAATAALTALVAALIFTKSRGALVGLVAIVGFLLMYLRAYIFRASLVIIPACTLFILFLPSQFASRTESVLGLLSNEQAQVVRHDQSIYNRLDSMLVGLDMFTQHPVGGVGLRNYAELFQKHVLNAHYAARHEARDAHSLYLEVAAEQGLIGLLALITLYGYALHTAFFATNRLSRRSIADASLPLAIGLSLIGFLAASIFLHEAYARTYFIVIGMALALPQCMEKLKPRISSTD